MVNKCELEIVKKYESKGWRTLRGGAPDFVFLKIDGKGEIEDFVFVEVKAGDKPLTYEQMIYRKILAQLGAKYVVERTRPVQTNPILSELRQSRPHPSEPTRTSSFQANLMPSQTNPSWAPSVQTSPHHAILAPAKPHHSNSITSGE